MPRTTLGIERWMVFVNSSFCSFVHGQRRHRKSIHSNVSSKEVVHRAIAVRHFALPMSITTNLTVRVSPPGWLQAAITHPDAEPTTLAPRDTVQSHTRSHRPAHQWTSQPRPQQQTSFIRSHTKLPEMTAIKSWHRHYQSKTHSYSRVGASEPSVFFISSSNRASEVISSKNGKSLTQKGVTVRASKAFSSHSKARSLLPNFE